MSTLQQQLYEAGLAPPWVCLANDHVPGVYMTELTKQIWRPSTDWAHAIWYVERYRLEIIPSRYPDSPHWGVRASDGSHKSELAETFSNIPAAVCLLVLRIEKES